MLAERANLLPYIGSHFDTMSHLAQTLTPTTTFDKAIDSLLKNCATTLRGQPAAVVERHVQQLCAQPLSQLRTLLDTAPVTAGDAHVGADKENTPARHIEALNRLAAIFRPLSAQATPTTQAPWLSTVQQLWPLYERSLPLYESDKRFVEYWTRCVRLTVRSLGQQSLPFVEPLALAMINTYTKHSEHSCILYLASILVDEYGALVQFQPGLIHLVEVHCARTVYTLLTILYRLFPHQRLLFSKMPAS
jgi:hypothetical protein